MANVWWQLIEESDSWPVKERAIDFLKGHVETISETIDGEQDWMRPQRFTAAQMRSLVSCAAWHPALFRAQSRATAGICVEVKSAAQIVALEVARDTGIRPLRDDSLEGARDGISIDVDDEHHNEVIALQDKGSVVVEIDPSKGALQEHTVRFWLPYLSGCCVRNVLATGPVEVVSARKKLLVLGDSIAQGERAQDPGLSWTARVVREAHVDVINQGLLGQVFQPSALAPLMASITPDMVWVALGLNYRHEVCYPGVVERDVRGFLALIHRQWSDCPAWVATPTPHDELMSPSSPQSCWEEVPAILERAIKRWPRFELVEGSDLVDEDPLYFADADHPNARGHQQMARRIARVLEGGEPLDEAERKARAVPGFLRDIEEAASGSGIHRFADEETSESDIVETSEAVRLEVQALDGLNDDGALGSDESLVTQGFESDYIEEASYEVDSSVEMDEPQETPDTPEFEVIEPDVIEFDIPEPEPISPEATAVLDLDVLRARQEAQRRRSIEDDTKALLELLSEGSIDSVPLEQILIRGLGEPTYVSEGFCSVDLPNGTRCIWGEDVIEARRVLARQRRPNLIICLTAELESMVRRMYRTTSDTLWYTLAVYEGTDPLPVESDLEIRPLDNSWAGVIARSYSYPTGVDGAELAHMLGRGLMLGGFDPEGRLVGFIGEWYEGAMGLLEILPHARRRGYGSALESAKANEHLAKGWTPYAQIMEGNDASLKLQEALGFTLASRRQCYIPMID